MSPKTQPNNPGDIVQVAGSSLHIEMPDTNAGRDVQQQSLVQVGVASSPDKTTLKNEVSELRDYLAYTQIEVESYVKAVRVSALDKAKALIADKRAGFDKLLAATKSSLLMSVRLRSPKQRPKSPARLFLLFSRKMPVLVRHLLVCQDFART